MTREQRKAYRQARAEADEARRQLDLAVWFAASGTTIDDLRRDIVALQPSDDPTHGIGIHAEIAGRVFDLLGSKESQNTLVRIVRAIQTEAARRDTWDPSVTRGQIELML